MAMFLSFLIAFLSLARGQDIGLSLQSTSTILPNISIISGADIGGTALRGLDCFISGGSNAQDIGAWFKPDGSQILTTTFNSFYWVPAPGRVSLYKAGGLTDVSDEGIYTCNISGNTVYAGIYTVQNYNDGKPVVPSPPSFSLLSNLTSFPPSFSLNFTSTRFPPTFVNWTRNGIGIEIGSTYQEIQNLRDAIRTTFDNILIINGSFLPGNYTCSISNSQGYTESSFVVRAPDSPPSNLTASFLGAGDVRVSWTPPTGDIDGYQLYYQESGGSDAGLINITGTNESAVLRSLVGGASYNIYVIAYAHIPSESSETLTITLNVAGTPEAISVTPVSSNATALLIDWEEPQNGSTGVVEYIVHYQPTNVSTNCPGVKNGTIITNSINTSLLLTGLEENTNYTITISTISEAAVGEPSAPVTATTSTSAPAGPPLNVTAYPINPSSINITWEPPLCHLQNGPIRSYEIVQTVIKFNQPNPSIPVAAGRLSYMLTSVPPFRNNSIIVKVHNDNGSVASDRIYSHVIGIPNQVQGLGDLSLSITTVTLEWDPPKDRSGLDINNVFNQNLTYILKWYRAPADQSESISDGSEPVGQASIHSSTRYSVQRLLPNTTYRIYVFAKSSFGQETGGSFVDKKTTVIVSIDLNEVSEVNSTSVNVTWTPTPNGDVTQYVLYYNSSTDNSPGETSSMNITGHQSSFVVLTGLDNSATYKFAIAAAVYTTENGTVEGPISPVVSFTFTQHSNFRLIMIITGSIVGGLLLLVFMITLTVILLTLLNRSIGPRFAVKGEEGYLLVPLDSSDYSETTPTSNRPSIIGKPPTEVHAIEGQEVVLKVRFHGDPMPKLSWKQDGEEIDWENCSFMLKNGAIVFPYVEVAHSGEYEVTGSNDNGSESVSIVLTVYPETDLMAPLKEGVISSVRIPLEEFGQYVNNLRNNNNKLFREQFKRLGVPDLPTDIASSDENKPFNRNQNIVPYDVNIIELEPLPRFLDCQHTYVNASYIMVNKDDEQSQKYIATQGPLDRTVVDFWRMVWQEKACAIVMLTKLQEDLRIKCSQYWPSRGSEDYGPFTVTLQKETTSNSFIIRELILHYNTMMGNLRSKIVNPTGRIDPNKKEYYSSAQSTLLITHYQFIDWLEYGPQPPINSLVKFNKIISNQTEHKKGPIVVHCSTGGGRTGAFIAMTCSIKDALTESIIDIPAVVTVMREQRMMMIQTLDQYMLVHEAVLEQALCGDTQIAACDLQSTISSLSSSDNASVTGFEAQFNVLEQVSVPPQDAVCDVARQHPRKNRYQEILPTDQWRAHLKSESPDYINAVFIPSYKNDKGFIIAQSPLRETRRDFWKMIFDREITTIVMLSPIMEGEEEACAQYWPKEGTIEFGEFTISVREEWGHQSFSRKLLLVRNNKNNMLRRLAHFQVDGWSNDDITSCSEGAIINTMNLVKTLQRKSPNTPVLMHCSNMIGRSAVFCAAMATVDQMKSSSVVDVFQTVKNMRVNLPGAVQNKGQYKMIHTLAAAYVNLFSTSANF